MTTASSAWGQSRAVVIFVEGQADGWTVLRALGRRGAAHWNGRPTDLPAPFGADDDLINRWHKRVPLQEMGLAEGAEGSQPVFQTVARTDEAIFFIVRMGGDRKASSTLALVERLRAVFAEDLVVASRPIKQLAVAFCFDADTPRHHGQAGPDCVGYRAAAFCQQCGDYLGVQRISHTEWVQGSHFPVGLYVFCDPVTSQGTLEDVIRPALAQGPPPWPERLAAAEDFVRKHEQQGDAVAKKASDRTKAHITIAGQLASPGTSMAGVLKFSGNGTAVPSEVFDAPALQALATFLMSVPWTAATPASPPTPPTPP